MNCMELVAMIDKKTEFSTIDVLDALNTILKIVKDKAKVMLLNVNIFKICKKSERSVNNYKASKKINIDIYKFPTFKLVKALKHKFNK